MIVLDIANTLPRAFETFIDLLFDITSNINSSKDRVCRGTACQCLCELERSYPGTPSTTHPSNPHLLRIIDWKIRTFVFLCSKGADSRLHVLYKFIPSCVATPPRGTFMPLPHSV